MTSRLTDSWPKPSNDGNEIEQNAFSTRSQRRRSFIFSFEEDFVGNKKVCPAFVMTRTTRFDTRDDKTSVVSNQSICLRNRLSKKPFSYPTSPWSVTHTISRFDLSTRNDQAETIPNSSIMDFIPRPSRSSWRHMIGVQMLDENVHPNRILKLMRKQIKWMPWATFSTWDQWCQSKQIFHSVQRCC